MFYIGSSMVHKIQKGYRGSVSSKLYKEIWKQELKSNPHYFKTKIISKHTTDKEARNKELNLQKCLKVVTNDMYINRSLAKPNGFFGMNVSGKNHPRQGRLNTESHRNKISESTKGREPWNKGKSGIYSQKSLESNRQKHLGKEPWNKGKTGIYNQETLEKIERSQDWIVTSPQGEKYHVRNLAKFCRNNNLTKTHMGNVAKGKSEHHKKWKCQKVE